MSDVLHISTLVFLFLKHTLGNITHLNFKTKYLQYLNQITKWPCSLEAGLTEWLNGILLTIYCSYFPWTDRSLTYCIQWHFLTKQQCLDPIMSTMSQAFYGFNDYIHCVFNKIHPTDFCLLNVDEKWLFVVFTDNGHFAKASEND